MNVMDALYGRHATRAFLAKTVEKDKLITILEAAARTPSWANTQPWEVFIATGKTLTRIKNGYQDKYAAKAGSAPETPRPLGWSAKTKDRIGQLGLARERDCGSAGEQFGQLNQSMFNAPAVIFICMDKVLSHWSLYDIGAYSQSIMLAALEQGLSTMPAITLVAFPEIIRQELQLPDNLKITIGIAIGYADKEHGINNLRTDRSPLSETAKFYE